MTDRPYEMLEPANAASIREALREAIRRAGDPADPSNQYRPSTLLAPMHPADYAALQQALGKRPDEPLTEGEVWQWITDSYRAGREGAMARTDESE